MRALWEWAITTPGAGWTLPVLGALIGALLGVLAARALGRRALRRRHVRFFASTLDDVSEVPLGALVSLRGVLVVDEGASVPAMDGGRPVALACAVVDGEEGALLAHDAARGLALRTRTGTIPLLGPARIAWGAPERDPRRASRLPAALRERLATLADELASARIALRALPAGTEVIVEGVLQLRGPEGSSYRADSSARVLAGPVDVIAARPAPRAVSVGAGAAATATAVAVLAAYAPSWVLPRTHGGRFEPDARDVAAMLTPLRRVDARRWTDAWRGAPLDAESLRALWMLEELVGGCAHASSVALLRGRADEALAIAERCQPDDRALRHRVAALRAQGRFAEAAAVAEPLALEPRERARLLVQAGDLEGALRALDARPAPGVGPQQVRWRAPRTRTYVTQLVLDPPRHCDASCRDAAARVLAGEGTVELARSARPALDRAITTGDLETFDRLAPALAPFDATEVALARAAAALIWRRDEAPSAIAAIEPLAGPEQRSWAEVMLAATRGDVDGMLELPRHQICDHFGCRPSAWAEQLWRAAAARDERGISASRDRRGVLLAASMLEGRPAELAERLRSLRLEVSLTTPLRDLHGELLVERGIARAIGDDEWGAELDERIARFDGLFEREDLAQLLDQLD